ncbi:TPA: hypothetical protein ACMFP1_002938 [Pseudomonas aeruginosa]
MAIMRNPQVRRLRRPAATVEREDKAKAEKELNTKLQLIAVELAKVEAATDAMEALRNRVGELLRTLGKSDHEFAGISAAWKDEMTRASREVDPHKLYNKLAEKDFFAVVKVSLGELGKVLTEDEIDAIAKTIPATKKGQKLVVERKKAAAGRRK